MPFVHLVTTWFLLKISGVDSVDSRVETQRHHHGCHDAFAVVTCQRGVRLPCLAET